MGSEADRLLGLLNAPDRYGIPPGDLRADQIAAANEIFQERVERIITCAGTIDAYVRGVA